MGKRKAFVSGQKTMNEVRQQSNPVGKVPAHIKRKMGKPQDGGSVRLSGVFSSNNPQVI